MALIKEFLKKCILAIVLIALLVMFIASPSAEAKLKIADGEFYYSGTTEASYVASDGNIFDWLLDHLGDIADWILGILTMGIRMVFVGWTALFEKLLTWAMESTMQVTVGGEVVESATDHTAITTSSNNITVEAIVYNKVPALEINFFKVDLDKSRSGTGAKLLCSNCKQEHKECKNVGCKCKCDQDDKGCDVCKTVKDMEATDYKPVVIKIREFVATWYYILRVITVAGMLVVLIFIGIKMAISTIASDKAVYKRMLVDWVVGMIIIFTIHYFMILTIMINSTMVNAIGDAKDEFVKVQMMQLSEKNGEIKYDNSDIEIKVYEEIRTRAYDPKLTVGLSGMIMYMTLVYFAVRYTIVYLKRLFTVYVLALMGPPVGLAYALQKVISGRGSSLKKWMKEFVMAVIIQIVHAIIYAIFISQALILSLESVAGMIVGLFLINYSLKAEQLFRKIFKMSDGELAEDANNSGSVEKMQEKAAEMRGLAMGAKPLAEAYGKLPHMKLAKAAGNALGAGVEMGVDKASQGIKAGVDKYKSSNGRFDRLVDKQMRENGQGALLDADNGSGPSSAAYDRERARAEQQVREKHPEFVDREEEDKKLLEQGGNKLALKVDDAKENYDLDRTNENQKIYETARADYERFMQITAPTPESMYKEKKKRMAGTVQGNPNMKIFFKVVGTTHYDPVTRTRVSDENSLSARLSKNNRRGISAKQDKELQKIKSAAAAGVSGAFAILAAPALLATNPMLAAGLMAGGIAGFNNAYGAPTAVSRAKAYQGRFNFVAMSPEAMKNVGKNAIVNAETIRNSSKYGQIMERNKRLNKGLLAGTVGVATLGLATGGLGIIPAAALTGGALMASGDLQSSRLTTVFGNTKLASMYNDMVVQQVQQENDLVDEFVKENQEIQGILQERRTGKKIDRAIDQRESELHQSEREETEKLFGLQMDEEGNTKETTFNVLLDRKIESLKNEALEEQGKKVDEDTGKIVDISNRESTEEQNATTLKSTTNTKKEPLSAKEIKNIELEIAAVTMDVAASRGGIDTGTDAYIMEIQTRLDDRLKTMGYLVGKETSTDILQKGTLEKTIQKSADEANVRMEAANKMLDSMGIGDEAKDNLKTTVIVESMRAEKNGAQIDMDKIFEASGVVPKDTKKASIKELDQMAQVYAFTQIMTSARTSSNAVSKVESKQSAARRKKKATETIADLIDAQVNVDYKLKEADELTGDLDKYSQKESKPAGKTTADILKEMKVSTDEPNAYTDLLNEIVKSEELNKETLERVPRKKLAKKQQKMALELSDYSLESKKKKLEKMNLDEEKRRLVEEEEHSQLSPEKAKRKQDITSRISELDSSISDVTKSYNELRRQQITSGPTVDINKTIKDLRNKA